MRGSFGNTPSQEVTFNGTHMRLLGNTVEVGDWAPEFKAINNDLSVFDSTENSGKVVIYSSVPSIDTKVCSIQTRFFNEKATELGEDVRIVTISADLPFAQQRYCADEGIENSKVVSDYNFNDFGEKYGFIIEDLKLLSRGIVVVDRENRVAYVEYVKEVTDEVDYDKALKAVKEVL